MHVFCLFVCLFVCLFFQEETCLLVRRMTQISLACWQVLWWTKSRRQLPALLQDRMVELKHLNPPRLQSIAGKPTYSHESVRVETWSASPDLCLSEVHFLQSRMRKQICGLSPFVWKTSGRWKRLWLRELQRLRQRCWINLRSMVRTSGVWTGKGIAARRLEISNCIGRVPSIGCVKSK